MLITNDSETPLLGCRESDLNVYLSVVCLSISDPQASQLELLLCILLILLI